MPSSRLPRRPAARQPCSRKSGRWTACRRSAGSATASRWRYPEENGPSEIVGTPVCTAGRIYVTIGHDPMHGEGKVHPRVYRSGQGIAGLELRPDRTQHVNRGRERRPLVRGQDVRSRSLHEREHQHGPGLLDQDQRADLGFDAGGRWPGLRAHQPRPAGVRRGGEKKLLRSIEIGSGCYSSPVAANGVLYVASQKFLYAR